MKIAAEVGTLIFRSSTAIHDAPATAIKAVPYRSIHDGLFPRFTETYSLT